MSNLNAIGMIELGGMVESLACDQAAWSQETFGADTERGPIGALKHLEKEAKEAIETPGDIMEYADCLLLILDASRRAGFSYIELIKAGRQKLEICKTRVWPKTEGDVPTEHSREPRTEPEEMYGNK